MTMPDAGSGGTGTREQIRQVRDQVVDQAKSTFREARDRAGSTLADSFAGQVEQVAQYLREADLRTIGRDIERLARDRPAVVYGAAFAVGLLAARFFKSGASSEVDDRADAWNPDAGYERIRAGGEPAGLGETPYARGRGGYDASA